MHTAVESRSSTGRAQEAAGVPKNFRVIQQIVEAQAATRPHAVAVVCGEKRLTYRELNERANQIAHRLKRAGVGPEAMVGLYLQRSAEALAGILGILKAGGCYVPIDPIYPKDRVEYILENSGAKALIADEARAKTVQFAGQVILLDSNFTAVDVEAKTNPAIEVTEANAAYVIYTSGSTGRPKGVIVTHRNVVRLFTATEHWYGFDNADVWTVFHSLAFDFSVWEIWGALFYGGTAVVVPFEVSRSPEAFYELLAREGVTVLNQTPSAFRQLIWAEQQAAAKHTLKLRYVIFGGEALELQSLRPWFDRHGDAQHLLVNMYGITETTVHVTYRPIRLRDLEANLGSVIGEPIPDLAIELLDEKLQPVKVGEAGEICVGGEGVARGYLKRPELTAEKFINGGKLYRSGDLAKRLPNGDLEYLGRIDHQVKIHGFRIELGEIETVLNSHPGLRESVVIADDSTGDKRLVAYVTAKGDAPNVNDIREFAGRRLPAYMLPAKFIFLEKLPLTVNGKVDRKALPAPDTARPTLAAEFVAPKTEQERALAAIWQEVLRVDQVGVNDNFFELGGDSIRSIQVLARAQEKGIRFSLQKLFRVATISGLLASLDEVDDDPVDLNAKPFAAVSEADRAKLPKDLDDAYPIARLQHGMIFHSDMDLESAIFHDVFSFRLDLPYDRALLQQAVQRLTQRHTIFRSSFHLTEFSEPLQLVHKDAAVPFEEEDFRHLSKEQQRAELIAFVEREKLNRFDWTKPPMMRLKAQRYSDKTFQFIVSFHHTIMDGWSLAMMLTELFQDYMGLVTGKDAGVQAPRVTYRDFVALEQKTIHSEESKKFWRMLTDGAEVHTLPRWPHQPEKRAHEQTRGPEIYYPDTLLASLQATARSCGVPIRTVLLAAHCRVMKLLTGLDDIMTGLVTNGRPQCLDGERLIGLFLNTVPFRVQVANQTWKELIKSVFKAEQDLIPHRRMPLSDIQQLAGGKTLFETTFDFVQFHVYQDLPGYKDHSFLEDHYFEANNFNFFVTFMLDASAANLQMHFDYNPNDFSREQIQAICDYYSETLRAIAAAPDAPVEQAIVLPSAERRKVTSEWNQTQAPIPELLVHEQFEQRAATAPDAIAVIFGDERLTYAELNARANNVAAALRRNGVTPDMPVGICVERSANMVVGMLGILKAGGAYVPLDPTYPEERLAFMAKDAALKLVVVSSKTSATAAKFHSGAVCVVDSVETEKGLPNGDRCHPTGANLAYIIYTSGSTGLPKGVQIPHRALSNFLASMQKEPGLKSSDTLLAVTTYSFDIAGLEIWLPLANGATVVVASSDDARNTEALARLIAQHNVTVLQATPVTWSALLDAGWKGAKSLKALIGGEALAPALAEKLAGKVGELWNMYGPTETTIWSTICKVEPGSQITIGRPIANTEILILDSNLNPTPIGTAGEIFIGGDGLARGYLNRAELTAEKFIAHPFKAGAKLYRTGDLGHFLPDGRIVCLGRSDSQVKVRGFRVELGEIESVLQKHPAVRKAVVVTRDDGAGAKELAGYWIPNRAGAVTRDELRAFVKNHLPDYMTPTAWQELKEFPLTPNGKIDRKRLPNIETQTVEVSNGSGRRAPATPTEVEVANRWKTALKVKDVGLTDDFFSLGGHSLLAMRLLGGIRSKYNVEVSLARFFEEPTVQALARHVEELLEAHCKKAEGQNLAEVK